MSDVFLLSPAYCSGRRAAILFRHGSPLDIARRLQSGTLTLGEAFAFFSGLYFRGKLAYARVFTAPAMPDDAADILIITPTRGLLPPETPITPEILQEFAGIDLDPDDPRYRTPLVRDATMLAERLPVDARVVLLGSIASSKYISILSDVLGRRLHYPIDFIGRGDMSRGGLLLRRARAGTALEYVVLDPSVTLRGPRPPKLEPLPSPRRNSPVHGE